MARNNPLHMGITPGRGVCGGLGFRGGLPFCRADRTESETSNG